MPGSRAFPKSVRLRKRREFLQLQRQGRRRHTPSFVLVHSPAAGPVSRLGVTVSSKVGNSVVRSRVKRLVREVFRAGRTALPAIIDVVVIAKPAAAQITYAQAASELEPALGLAARG